VTSFVVIPESTQTPPTIPQLLAHYLIVQGSPIAFKEEVTESWEDIGLS